jgi:putative tryptophan/tyrosine transport system substrate-binding protein
LIALARSAFGQGRPHRIGFLGAESASGYGGHLQALRTGLREQGYVEGKNIVIEFRWADGQYGRLPGLAEELVRSKVEIIVTHGVPGTAAAKRATKTVPIVMASAGDAAATGLVSNLARPEGNVTGSTFFAPEVGAKRLDLLKEALPGLRRAAYLSVAGNPITERLWPPLERFAKALQVDLVPMTVRDIQEVAAAISKAAAQTMDAVVVPEFSLLRATAPTVAQLAEKHRLSSIGFPEFASAGGLLGYGPVDAALYRRAAVFIDKLLRGAKPGELPVERASTFELVVNRGTAKRLDVILPPPFLVRADRVVE